MTVSVDVQIMQYLTHFHTRWPRVDGGMLILNNSELVRGGVMMCLFWWVFFAKENSPEEETLKRAKLAAALPAALLALLVARTLANLLPFRTRPFLSPQFHCIWARLDLSSYENWSSFPSDHAALFMALAVSIFVASRRAGILAILYVLGAICLPRVYLGLHWFSDVVAGIGLGALAGSLVSVYSFRDRVWRLSTRWKQMSPGSLAAFAVFMTCSIWTLFGDTRSLARVLWALFVGKRGA